MAVNDCDCRGGGHVHSELRYRRRLYSGGGLKRGEGGVTAATEATTCVESKSLLEPSWATGSRVCRDSRLLVIRGGKGCTSLSLLENA